MISVGREMTAQMSGTFCCCNDLNLTLVGDTAGLVGLTGYSVNELQEIHQNCLMNLVNPLFVDKLRRELAEQLAESDQIEEAFPLICKNESVKWLMCRGCKVADADGQEYLAGILVDITRSKQKYDAQKKTLEQYQIILSQTENVVFEWDCIRDTISFSRAWEKVFGYAPSRTNVVGVLNNGVTFHPEDVKQLMKQLRCMQEGNAYQTVDIRIMHVRGEYMWCRLRATGIYDDSTGKLLKIVGVIIVIEDEMKATMALQERAEHDSLTGLLNANTTRKRAEAYLSECLVGEKCALLVVDLDHFKDINDRFGHMHGDAVLVQVAETLRTRFRSQDIVGRIGGEEFVVLIKDVSDSELIHKRCCQLLKAMHEIYKGSMEEIVVSCSIGAVMAKAKGAQYSQLFDCADQAMYQAKKQGRDQYVFCDIREM